MQLSVPWSWRLFVVLLALTLSVCAQQTCFESYRFPKVIQANTSPVQNEARAITEHASLKSLFVGGSITQAAFKPRPDLTFVEWAQVGRISLEKSNWLWTKTMTDSVNSLKTITALAVNPAGTKLAVHGESGGLDLNSFFFVLSADSGAPVSKLMKVQYSA